MCLPASLIQCFLSVRFSAVFISTVAASLMLLVMYDAITFHSPLPLSTLADQLYHKRSAKDSMRETKLQKQLHEMSRGSRNDGSTVVMPPFSPLSFQTTPTTKSKSDKEALVYHTLESDKEALLYQPWKGTQKPFAKSSPVINSSEELDRLINVKDNYLLRGFTGRLGNVLFELASAFCIALKNNLTLIIGDGKRVKDLQYQGLLLTPEVYGDLRQRLIIKASHGERFCCSFDERLMTLKPTGHSHVIHGYLQSWKYFEPCKKQVNEAITFKEEIVRNATKIVRGLQKKFVHRVLVGVHVRMEDYLRSAAHKSGKKTAPPEYYLRAMTYFREKHGGVTFVVITSQPAFFRRNVTAASDVAVLERSHTDDDVIQSRQHLHVNSCRVGTIQKRHV